MTEVLTYEALKAKCDRLEQINAQTLQVKLTMAETIKELTDRAERLSGMLTESRVATKSAEERADALAVENAALKSAITGKAYIDFVTSNGWNPGMKTINGKFAGFMDAEIDFGCMAYDHAKKLIDAVETPATDAALAAIHDAVLDRVIAKLGSMGSPDFTLMAVQALKNELREGK
ncbi:hypothetical protein V3510_003377 [Serratia marcescens]|nr:hypothetical protein [Serratia marcescens]